ncbi:hypothetical protein GEOBRER4_n2083 [Citrifermentans bremense]|uniref:DUF4384 domain-containing protein n=1 Tax=Citrifermentans bremense TaxID=60035 RepID=A0A6S6M760_9BACT|nr:DUF4384 domain-containing protein [Citrifermentans bremense]BCG47255.1 hypothetical protein GEOBRER4_n2083 [Citrifermentans bremense]
MKRFLLVIALLALLASELHAAESMVTEVEGYACMGDDRSRKQTELAAFNDAKRKAAEFAVVHIQSESLVKDGMLEKDLVSAYSNAQVKVVQELDKKWYKEEGLGDCFKVSIKAEVLPDEKAMAALAEDRQKSLENDPGSPLSVRVWTDKKRYLEGERIKVYLKGNKPFYGRVVYRDAGGSLVQLLPNPYRESSYFNGGVVYELPSGGDRYDMVVSAPLGNEAVTVYASTAPPGDVEVEADGAVFGIKTKASDLPLRTRGVKITAKGKSSQSAGVAEFSEAKTDLSTETN